MGEEKNDPIYLIRVEKEKNNQSFWSLSEHRFVIHFIIIAIFVVIFGNFDPVRKFMGNFGKVSVTSRGVGLEIAQLSADWEIIPYHPATYWVESSTKLSSGKKIKIDIDGSVYTGSAGLQNDVIAKIIGIESSRIAELKEWKKNPIKIEDKDFEYAEDIEDVEGFFSATKLGWRNPDGDLLHPEFDSIVCNPNTLVQGISDLMLIKLEYEEEDSVKAKTPCSTIYGKMLVAIASTPEDANAIATIDQIKENPWEHGDRIAFVGKGKEFKVKAQPLVEDSKSSERNCDEITCGGSFISNFVEEDHLINISNASDLLGSSKLYFATNDCFVPNMHEAVKIFNDHKNKNNDLFSGNLNGIGIEKKLNEYCEECGKSKANTPSKEELFCSLIYEIIRKRPNLASKILKKTYTDNKISNIKEEKEEKEEKKEIETAAGFFETSLRAKYYLEALQKDTKNNGANNSKSKEPHGDIFFNDNMGHLLIKISSDY